MLNASYTRMLQENRTFLDNEFESRADHLVSQRYRPPAPLHRHGHL